MLSTQELDRARRFHLPLHARRFSVCRALLRLLLARYLDREAAAIRLVYGESGKPRLAREQNPDGLCFNLSHSGDIAVFAVARSREVGIDVERIAPEVDLPALARRVLGDAELQRLDAAAKGERLETFFRYWTCKEAYLKARGEGITDDLKRIAIHLPRDAGRARITDRRDSTAGAWSLRELDCAPGYRAALAVEGRELTVCEQTLGRTSAPLWLRGSRETGR